MITNPYFMAMVGLMGVVCAIAFFLTWLSIDAERRKNSKRGYRKYRAKP
jgi:cytochrome bd-type quinol oxidase subunit 1